MNPYIATIDELRMQHCFINRAALNVLAQKLAVEELKIPEWRGPVFPEWDDDRIIDYFGVVNAVNFCFMDFRTETKFDVMYKSEKPWMGAYALAAAFTRAIEEGCDVLNSEYLCQISENDVKQIFRCHSTPIPMLNERVEQLRSIGRTFQNSTCKSFAQLFRECDYRIIYDQRGIVDRLIHFRAYRDISEIMVSESFEPGYHDIYMWAHRELPFCKRAQLFPMVYHGRALSSGGKLQPIRDPEHFGAVADYEVPRALRAVGVLEYDTTLADRVDSGIVIPMNSRMEVEIRMATVFAMTELLEKINKRCSNVIGMAELDYAVWVMGRDPNLPKSRHHYTYTTAY